MLTSAKNKHRDYWEALTSNKYYDESSKAWKEGSYGRSVTAGMLGAFNTIGNFLGSSWGALSEGFSGNKEEDKDNSLSQEELDKEMAKASEQHFLSTKSHMPRRITSSLLLSGAYKR